jgi:type I restriction enzyme S subunit
VKSELLGISIPFPPLPEQHRIVAILDAAFDHIATARANCEANLLNARAIFESHLQAVFTQRGDGWVEKPIGEVCDLLNGYAFKSGDAVTSSSTQLIRMGNLYGNVLTLDRSPVFYPDQFSLEHQKYLLAEGDIIMSLTGTTDKEDYGYAVRVPASNLALLMNQRIVKFDSINERLVNRDYLLLFLRSRVFLDVLYATANGTRQANLSSVTIKTLVIPLYSVEKQKFIADSLMLLQKETQRLASLYQRKLQALDDLKKSLLHQAFSGAL